MLLMIQIALPKGNAERICARMISWIGSRMSLMISRLFSKDIADHLRSDVDLKIDKIIDCLRQMRDMELGY